MAQAETVMRMAARAASSAERQVYETIAEGWRKLALEAARNEKHDDMGRSEADPAPFRQASAG